MLARHLEQIHVSASGIGDLEFSVSRPFTNALLHNREITALIRDTEPHEQGLFSVVPTLGSEARSIGAAEGASTDAARRRTTVHPHTQAQSSTIARVLGSDLLHKIRASSRDSSRGRRVDVEVLLQGAEKLCAVYALPGTVDRIAALRQKHDRITEAIKHHEERLSSKQLSVNTFDAPAALSEPPHEDTDGQESWEITDEEIKNEEDAIKELEARKKALETRVAGIERDLGGLLK